MSKYNHVSAEQHTALRQRFDWLLKGVAGGSAPPKAWIAGGALRAHFAREPVKDIDVFAAKASHLNPVRGHLIARGWELAFSNERVENWQKDGAKVDLVLTGFDSPVATLDKFDFTVACAAMTLGQTIVHPEFFEHLAARQLVINALPFPVATLVRLQRYINKGYRCCPEELRKLALYIVNSQEPRALAAEPLYHAID